MSHHLVTGGAGFIGSALTRRLIREGHSVTVLDRFSRGKTDRVPKEALTVPGDIRDTRLVLDTARGCDVIWHLAYVQGTQTFYADPKDVIDVALRGIMNVLRACERENPTLFLLSSSEVYQNPPAAMFPTGESVPLTVPDVLNPRYSYGAGKIASEVAALAYAPFTERTVIVRPHNIYGPDMGYEHVIPEFAGRMMNLIRTREHSFPIQGTGYETRSFCHIDDCIDGLMILHDQGADRNVYHLGNPFEEHAIRDLAFMVADWFEHEILIQPGVLPKGSPTRRLPDTTKLEALGYDPKVPLTEGLAITLDWYRQEDRVMA